MAARTLHSKYDSRDLTANARSAFMGQFEDQVDPNRELPEAERIRRAQHARSAYFTRLALESPPRPAAGLPRGWTMSHEKSRPTKAANPKNVQGDGHHRDITGPSESAEAALLGSMIINCDARSGALDVPTKADFDNEAHRVIFITVAAMHADGSDVDQLLVNDRLCAAGQIDHVGGLDAVWHLTSIEGCPCTWSWESYAQIVKRESRRRRGIATLGSALERLQSGEDPAVIASELAVAV